MVLPLERAAAPNFEQFSQKIQQVFVQKVKMQLFSAYLLQFTIFFYFFVKTIIFMYLYPFYFP